MVAFRQIDGASCFDALREMHSRYSDHEACLGETENACGRRCSVVTCKCRGLMSSSVSTRGADGLKWDGGEKWDGDVGVGE